jgi:NAD(P)-dependent dehydrogenase (short-subunit alcohol dehydrogenase family)
MGVPKRRRQENSFSAPDGYVPAASFLSSHSAVMIGRMGSPTDMAGIALFLSSKAGAHLSGNHILADGGAFWSGMGYSRL